jgi:hypothetical protein
MLQVTKGTASMQQDELRKLGFSDEAISHPSPRQTIETVRRQADQLLLRALADSKLREELKSDPVRVFVSVGLPVGAAEDLERQLEIDGVMLANRCTITCLTTCWLTDWFQR